MIGGNDREIMIDKTYEFLVISVSHSRSSRKRIERFDRHFLSITHSKWSVERTTNSCRNLIYPMNESANEPSSEWTIEWNEHEMTIQHSINNLISVNLQSCNLDSKMINPAIFPPVDRLNGYMVILDHTSSSLIKLRDQLINQTALYPWSLS